ncbi:multicilin isoform X2 [Hippocampus zosterae]|uniref:multicilin isoform X2 n=1 Tax=Hippocampus zosterae TaxID=109293 RepID=UPI00223D365B|nr:multicilin isoform X2 [Hippocampus zosterae]
MTRGIAQTENGEMKMHGERSVFAAAFHRGGRIPRHVDKLLEDKVPRSSSPVTIYVELPCNIEQAFPTISWDDLEDCTRKESDSLSSQVNGCDGGERDFGDFALDFMADSPATLESSLSPAELVPFQGCDIPPLTPQHIFSPDEGFMLPNSSCTHDQDALLWTSFSSCQARMGCAMEANNQVPETFRKRQSDPSEERNLHLRQLACQAKLLASVLEKLMADREPDTSEPARPCGDKSTSPRKRQRLDDGWGSPDLVEEILKDVSKRCDAVLHTNARGSVPRWDKDTIPMYGSFSGLQTSICKDGSSNAEEDASSFCTSVKEHDTIRTRVFPQGRAFTSGTHYGGFRFRWVPNLN